MLNPVSWDGNHLDSHRNWPEIISSFHCNYSSRLSSLLRGHKSYRRRFIDHKRAISASGLFRDSRHEAPRCQVSDRRQSTPPNSHNRFVFSSQRCRLGRSVPGHSRLLRRKRLLQAHIDREIRVTHTRSWAREKHQNRHSLLQFNFLFDGAFQVRWPQPLQLNAFDTICFSVHSILTCMMGDTVRSKPWLGLLGNISACMATAAAFGLSMYLGVEFIGINLAAPFLMIGESCASSASSARET